MDIACTALSGLIGYDVIDLSIYTGTAASGLLTKYPQPQTSIYGHIMPFSFHVIILNAY